MEDTVLNVINEEGLRRTLTHLNENGYTPAVVGYDDEGRPFMASCDVAQDLYRMNLMEFLEDEGSSAVLPKYPLVILTPRPLTTKPKLKVV